MSAANFLFAIQEARTLASPAEATRQIQHNELTD
jgi:hypothetical protein